MSHVILKNVFKKFGDVGVIHNVGLQIEKGEFVVFVGPSGCGKSTLLRLIAGLDKLTEGEISIAGRTVMDLPPSKRGIAMVFSLMPCILICQYLGIWRFLLNFSVCLNKK